MLTGMFFHSATICTMSKDYNYLFMLQGSPFYVNITNKTPILFLTAIWLP